MPRSIAHLEEIGGRFRSGDRSDFILTMAPEDGIIQENLQGTSMKSGQVCKSVIDWDAIDALRLQRLLSFMTLSDHAQSMFPQSLVENVP